MSLKENCVGVILVHFIPIWAHLCVVTIVWVAIVSGGNCLSAIVWMTIVWVAIVFQPKVHITKVRSRRIWTMQSQVEFLPTTSFEFCRSSLK